MTSRISSPRASSETPLLRTADKILRAQHPIRSAIGPQAERNTRQLRQLLKGLTSIAAAKATECGEFMRLPLFLICALAVLVDPASAEPGKLGPNDVIAVNVLLQPDQQMVARAVRINGALRKSYPRGFALDASHVPHVSVLHGYVRAKNLSDVYSAVQKVSAGHPLIGRQLTEKGIEHKPWGNKEITNLKIEKTPELEAFQADLVAAVAPHLAATGDASAFVTSTDDATVDQETVEYVRTFVGKHTGASFEPHITVGIGDAETARQISAQQEAPVTLTVASIAVFQLGNVGTARKELWRYSPR